MLTKEPPHVVRAQPTTTPRWVAHIALQCQQVSRRSMMEPTLKISRCAPRELTHLGEWTLARLVLTDICAQRAPPREMPGTTAAPRDPTVSLEFKPNAQLALMGPWREPRTSSMDVQLAHQATTAKLELLRGSLSHAHKEDTVLRELLWSHVQQELSTTISMEEVSVIAELAQQVHNAES